MDARSMSGFLTELRAQISQVGFDFTGAANRRSAARARKRVRASPHPLPPPRQAPAQAEPVPLEPSPEPATPRQKLADFRFPATRPEAHTGELLGRCMDCKRKLAASDGRGTRWCSACYKKHQQALDLDVEVTERQVKKRTRCPTCGGVKRKTDYQCERCFRARHTRFAQMEARLAQIRAFLEECGQWGSVDLLEGASQRDPWALIPVLDKWLKDRGWKQASKVQHWVAKAWFKPVYQGGGGDPWEKLRGALKNLAPKLGGSYSEQLALATGEPDEVIVTVPGHFTITAELPSARFAVASIQVTRRRGHTQDSSL